MFAFVMSLAFPKSIAKMGKDGFETNNTPDAPAIDGTDGAVIAESDASPKLSDEEIKQKLREIFAETIGKDESEITDDGHFMNDLGGTSLDYYEMVVQAEDAFGVKLEFESEDFSYSLDELVSIVKSKL